MGTTSKSKKKILASAKARSTNTSKIIPNTDGRTKAARHLRTIYRALRDADPNGWTIGKEELAKAAAGLSVFCAQQRNLLVNDDPAYDHDAALRATNSLRRLLHDLGHNQMPGSDDDDDDSLNAYLEGRPRRRIEVDDE